MFKRLDPHEIIVEHYKTFNDNNTGKLDYYEISFQILFPLLIGICLSIYIEPSKDVISNIIVAFSIASGFLFSLLVPLCDLSSHLKEKLSLLLVDSKNNYEDSIEKLNNSIKLAEELFYNASFALVLCLISVLLSIILLFIITPCTDQNWMRWIFEAISYTFYFITLFTMLVIIQRVFKIFQYRLTI